MGSTTRDNADYTDQERRVSRSKELLKHHHRDIDKQNLADELSDSIGFPFENGAQLDCIYEFWTVVVEALQDNGYELIDMIHTEEVEEDDGKT